MKYSEEEIKQTIKTCGADYLGYEIAEMLQQLLDENKELKEKIEYLEQVAWDTSWG